MEENWRTWPCAATYWWPCTWWECPAVMPNRLGVKKDCCPRPSKLQIGRQHLKDMRSNAMSSSKCANWVWRNPNWCSQDVQDFLLQIHCHWSPKSFETSPLELKTGWWCIKMRFKYFICHFLTCSPLKKKAETQKERIVFQPSIFKPLCQDETKNRWLPATKTPHAPAPENSRLSWVQQKKGQLAMPRAKGCGCFYEGVHEFGKPWQYYCFYMKKNMSPFSHERFFFIW